jgi:hypothetical protein
MHKVNWFGAVRGRKLTDICFDAWKSYLKQMKTAKKFVLRSIKGVDKSIKNDAFELWKELVFAQRKKIYVDNIEELKRRHDEHD